MNFQAILKGRTAQALTLAGGLALAGTGYAQGYERPEPGPAGSSGAGSGQQRQMPNDQYHQTSPHKDAQREQLNRNVEGAKRRDDMEQLDPGKYVPGSPANKPPHQ